MRRAAGHRPSEFGNGDNRRRDSENKPHAPIFKIEKTHCPFVFPIKVVNRDSFRAYLIDHQIYCAVHWPFDQFQNKERQQAIQNGQTLISLPVDQRYQKESMDYLFSKIKEYRELKLC